MEPKEVVPPPRPRKQHFSFHEITEANYQDTCLANKKLCLIFFFDKSLPEKQFAEVATHVEEELQEHYAEFGYTYLKTTHTSLDTLPQLRTVLESQPSLKEGKPGVLVINRHKGKTASWIPPEEETGVNAWKMFGNFMDRLTGGEIRFSKANFEGNTTSSESNGEL